MRIKNIRNFILTLLYWVSLIILMWNLKEPIERISALIIFIFIWNHFLYNKFPIELNSKKKPE